MLHQKQHKCYLCEVSISPWETVMHFTANPSDMKMKIICMKCVTFIQTGQGGFMEKPKP